MRCLGSGSPAATSIGLGPGRDRPGCGRGGLRAGDQCVAASAELRLAAAPVLVWLGSDRHCLLLAVADVSARPPVRLNLEPDAEGGRGLALVEALSSRWGWHLTSVTGLRKVTGRNEAALAYATAAQHRSRRNNPSMQDPAVNVPRQDQS